MFDNLIREISRLNGDRVSVPLPSDAEGYLDRECPSTLCLFHFKVQADDWRDKVHDEAVFCPFCGHTAQAGVWNTSRQVEHAKAAAIAQLQGRVGSAMQRDAQDWNRRQPRGGLIRITMQVDNKPCQVSLPPAAAATMEMKITCPACACRYAVIGAAFFCPACGHNAADLMFHQALGAVRAAMDTLSEIRAAIPDPDTAENTRRLLVEHGLQSAVTAFQRYAETLHSRFPAAPRPRRNAFQSIEEGSALWRQASGKGYAAYITAAEVGALTRYFQQRHLLAHTQGIVDQDYIARSGDSTYRPGQRLVVRETDVRECLALIATLTSGMKGDTPSSKDAPT